jgi:hypothetical protein
MGGWLVKRSNNTICAHQANVTSLAYHKLHVPNLHKPHLAHIEPLSRTLQIPSNTSPEVIGDSQTGTPSVSIY